MRWATLYVALMATAWVAGLTVIGEMTGHLLACVLLALGSLAAGTLAFWVMVRAFGMPGKRRPWEDPKQG
jgi:hypothetical protein